ncbi:MAG: hypothetical protein RL266_2274, partial [Bacteroidota bacterium]
MDSSTLRIEERLKLLQRENDLLNSIIQSASDSIYAKDLEGRYITINQAGAGFLGKTIEEVIGRTDEELVGNEGKRIMIWDQRLFESGEAVVYESSSLINGESKHFWTSKS